MWTDARTFTLLGVCLLATLHSKGLCEAQRRDSRRNNRFLALDNDVLDFEYSRTKYRKLGSDCSSDKECHAFTKGSRCFLGRCRCDARHIQVGTKLCLRGVLLGYPCAVNAQCSLRVENAGCVQGYCQCGKGYAPYRRSNCLLGASLGDACRSDDQCRIVDEKSFCRFVVPRVYGYCRCSPDAAKVGQRCLFKNITLGAPCSTSRDCSAHIPEAVCRVIPEHRGPSSRPEERESRISSIPGVTPERRPSSACQCPYGFIGSNDGRRCIPVLKGVGLVPVSLGQTCDSSDQCQATDPNSYCINSRCECGTISARCSSSNRGCYKDTFQCASDGRCISWYFVCDGSHDCADGSDEAVCLPHRCSPLAFTCGDGSCVSRAKLCDGRADCVDGKDEAHCSGACPATTFRCRDGQCLPGFVFCNATPTCRDRSDEDERACIQGALDAPFCPFRCRNGRCRSTAILCSGTDGCGDNSDEEHCSVCACPPTFSRVF